jgi:hypothetical protein
VIDAYSVLAEAEALITGDRNEAYGPFEEDYGRTVGMFNAWRGEDAGPLTIDDALMLMVFVKLSRERHRHSRDNITDAIGYLAGLHRVRGV